MLSLLLILQLTTPINWDYKPTLVLTSGLVLDGISTKYCLDSNPNAYEGNKRYTQAPYDRFNPNYSKMWTEKVLLIGGYVALSYLVKHYSNKAKNELEVDQYKNGRRWIHFFGYGVGSSLIYISYRNVKVC